MDQQVAHEDITVAMAQQPSRLQGVQLGRAVAAITVVVTHAVAHPFAGAPGLSHLLGRYGVTLFFVISGYIMVFTTGRGSFDRRAFMMRRIKRIVPIYYIANATLFTGRLLVPGLFKDAVLEPWHVLKSILFIPAYQANGSGLIFPFFRLGWTLNYEMFFYLCFALLAGLQMKARSLTLAAIFLFLFVLGLRSSFTDAIALFYTQVDLFGFLAGMWLGSRALTHPGVIARSTQFGLLLISVVCLAWAAFYYATLRTNPIMQIVVIVACTIHLRLLVAAIDDARRTVPPFAQLLADASYSMYLFHMFAIGFVVAVSKMLGGVFIYLFMPVSVGAGIVIGILVYSLVERPLGRAINRYWPTKASNRAPTPAA